MKYQVKSPLKDGDGLHEVGSQVEMDEQAAAPLIAIGVLGEPVEESQTEPTDPAERLAAIQVAIAALEKGEAGNWMKDGRPNAGVLSKSLGWGVGASERDAAWAAIQESQDKP